MTKKTLTPKQVKFIDEYLIDRNGKQAAIRAGYSPRSAEVQASKMLRKGKVKSEIDKLIEKMSEDAGITAKRVIEELGKIAFSNMGDFWKSTSDGDPYLDFSNLTPEQTAALSEVTVEDYIDGRGEDVRDVKKVKIKLADKIRALGLLGKHFKMFTDKIEHSGQIDFSVDESGDGKDEL